MTFAKYFALPLIPLAAVLLLAGCKPDKDCVKTCLARYNCDMSFTNNPHVLGRECLIDQNKCEKECGVSSNTNSSEMISQVPINMPIPAPVEVKKGPYGAVAYDQSSGAWGVSSASADKTAAATSALGFCKQHGPNCVVVSNFKNGCAAIASGPANIVTWANAATLSAARAKAQTDCVKKANDACEIKFGDCYRESEPAKTEGNKGVRIISQPSEQ